MNKAANTDFPGIAKLEHMQLWVVPWDQHTKRR